METDNNFQNRPLAPDSLPAYEAAPLSPVSPRYAPYVVLKEAIRWGIVAGVLAFAWLGGHLPESLGIWAPAAAVALGGFSGCVAWMDAKRRGYALREHDVIYVRGVFVRRTVILPLSRVQHVASATGPLERRFNLVRLTCFTAGGLGADLVIGGLEKNRAEQVRQFLVSRMQGSEKPEKDEGSDAGK